jgi:hypothetical protein
MKKVLLTILIGVTALIAIRKAANYAAKYNLYVARHDG